MECRKNILLWLAIAYLAGDFAGVFAIDRIPQGLFGLIIPAVTGLFIPVLGVLLILLKRHSAFIFAILFVTGVLNSAGRACFNTTEEQSVFAESRDKQICGVIDGKFRSSKGRPRLTLLLPNGESTWLYMGASQDEGLRVGDSLCLGVRAVKADFSTPRGMHYVCFPAKGPQKPCVRPCARPSLRYRMARRREALTAYMDSTLAGSLSAPQRALMQSITYGERINLDSATRQMFADAGVMHLLALSGLHVGIVYALLRILLGILGRSRSALVIRSLCIILVLWAYALFTGCSTSLTRAVIMASIYEGATLLRRKRNGMAALGASAIIACLADPYAPLEAGFQLSYGAMLGIFLLYPAFEGIRVAKPLKPLWQMCGISFSAQVFTLPLGLIMFGRYPMFSLLAGILCTPLTWGIMLATPLYLVSGLFPPGFTSFTIQVSDFLTQFFLKIAQLLSIFAT